MKISTVFWLLLLCTTTFSLFYGGVDYRAIRSVNALWNLGHIVYFALTVYLLAKLSFIKKISLPYQWLGFILLSLLWGTLIEVLQYGIGRTPDLADIIRDLTGCLLVLSFHPALMMLSSTVGKLLIRLLVLVILFFQLVPLSIALIDESIARSQFPILSNFETPFESGRWEGGADREVTQLDPESDDFELKVNLTTDTYSGVGMEYLPLNWSEYSSLNLRFFKPTDEPLTVVVRVHDTAHMAGLTAYAYNDRFNMQVNLKVGWNDIAIPLSTIEVAPVQRKMDLTEIRNVSFFVVRLPMPREVYLDKIYLSR